jgi:F-type H+-transporting ATPase subunit delta
MHVHPVTARYVEALANLAERAGAADAVGRDLERLRGLLAGGLAARLVDSRTPAEKRRAALAEALAGAHQLAKNFCLLAFDRRREQVVLEAPEAYRSRQLARAGVSEGVVESPRALAAGDLAALEAALSGRLGGRVKLSQRQNSELLAGVRVRVGSRMIDASAQGRLGELRRRMTDAPLPALPG